MEGVGARLGRSSSRYGAATVFSGPVRKWKKKWVRITPSSNSHNHNSNNSSSSNHAHLFNGTSTTNGNNGNASASHLLLYKWTPIPQSNKDNNNDELTNNTSGGGGGNEDKKASGKDENGDAAAAEAAEEPPLKRKFKYIPVALLEEQKKEAEEYTEDESKAADDDANPEEPAYEYENTGCHENPDINDVPMEESQDGKQSKTVSERQDLNESTLDLSLGLTSEGEQLESRSDQEHDGQQKN